MSLFCYALLGVLSSFAIILKRKRKLVALLLLSYRCIVTINVLWLFLMVPWVDLQCVIVVFPDHTHLLFVVHPLVLMNRLNKTESTVFLYCRFSLFLKDPFFQIIKSKIILTQIAKIWKLYKTNPKNQSRSSQEQYIILKDFF